MIFSLLLPEVVAALEQRRRHGECALAIRSKIPYPLPFNVKKFTFCTSALDEASVA
ncbi:hypothetical protein [Rhizobium rhizosphaerae]|uniref:hypothetical protein n=1 Tax=Xaviernesmea rhizosphaerae TaxID=1672749 RepID=UPI000A94DED6|nr:hypothetical protein [Xaviernesmea rhizosphaerae]